MTTELISRARSGDADAFRELTEPFRRELQVHCYRMLGSVHDAEDATQDTLLAAWQGMGGFEGRASVRTWLYRIATNRCLNALRTSKRRAAREWDMTAMESPPPTRRGEVTWLEPFPDHLLEGGPNTPLGPEARYEQTESISLAFITALQVLPPRQRAVLILREVLGYHADEVAGILDTSVESVTSALKRARAGLHRRAASQVELPAPAVSTAAEQELVTRFVRAYQAGDVDALVALLTADVAVTMPPVPLEWHGRAVVTRFYAGIFARGARYDLVPTRANGQPAFGAYLRARSGGVRHGAGLLVLTLTGDRISMLTRFDNDMLALFGLPSSLPG